MSEMVERVKGAIQEHWVWADGDLLGPTDEQIETVARAAIAAMREPTDKMVSAMDFFGRRENWRAAIDEALK